MTAVTLEDVKHGLGGDAASRVSTKTKMPPFCGPKGPRTDFIAGRR